MQLFGSPELKYVYDLLLPSLRVGCRVYNQGTFFWKYIELIWIDEMIQKKF